MSDYSSSVDYRFEYKVGRARHMKARTSANINDVFSFAPATQLVKHALDSPLVREVLRGC